MELRAVPGTDLRVSRLILGTMTFGGQVGPADAEAMVDVALDAGVNMFDTAPLYVDGESERILGDILKRKSKDVLVATKIHPSSEGLGKAAIGRAIDASLRRLQRDQVDLYYLHQPDWSTPIEESLGAMADLVRAGKVRHIGVSNYAAWQLCDMRYRCRDAGWPTVTVSQLMYNAIARRADEEYAALSDALDLFNVAYNPLAGGFLTGKHVVAQAPAEGTRFTNPQYRDRYWNDRQFAAVERLTAGAREAGLSLIELALRWMWSRPLVDVALLGASSVEHLRGNIRAADGPPLPEPLLRLCDDVWRDLRGVAPGYNR